MENLSISCYQSADPVSGKVYHWVGVNELVSPGHRRGLLADNPRVAICRAVVFAKLGHEVDTDCGLQTENSFVRSQNFTGKSVSQHLAYYGGIMFGSPLPANSRNKPSVNAEHLNTHQFYKARQVRVSFCLE